MEDFVRKTKGVRDITSLPLDTNHELDIVSDVKGKIYIKILNRYKELLFDNGTEQWVIDMLNNLEVDVEQLKEDILDLEQALSELPIIEDKLVTVETTLAQINNLFAQMQIDVQGLDLRTAELEREVVQLALKDQELLDKINNLDIDVDLDILYSNSTEFGDYDYSGNKNLFSKPFVASNITGAGNGSFVTQVDDSVRIEKSSAILDIGKTYEIFIGNLLNNTQYIISYDVLLESGSTGILNGCNIALEGKYGDKHEYIGVFQLHNITTTDVYQKVTSTFTSSANMEKYEKFKFRVYVATGVSLVLKIKHVKIERGSTTTPYQPNLLVAPYYLSKFALNDEIPYYKYVGINLEASKNPNDYQWIPLSKAAETVDARLTKTISTYDTVNALQNNRLTSLESKVVDTAWQNVTVKEPFTSVTQPQVKKQNGIVYMRGTISNGSGDCFTLPEGFRPPEGAYEMQFRLPCRSADASNYATMYVRPSGLCSIAGVNGTKPIFLSGIIFSTT